MNRQGVSISVPAICPTCGHEGKVPVSFQGRRVTCPKCKASFAVAGQPPPEEVWAVTAHRDVAARKGLERKDETAESQASGGRLRRLEGCAHNDSEAIASSAFPLPLIVFLVVAVQVLLVFLLGLAVPLWQSALLFSIAGILELIVWQWRKFVTYSTNTGRFLLRASRRVVSIVLSIPVVILKACGSIAEDTIVKCRHIAAVTWPEQMTLKCQHCGGEMFRTSTGGGCLGAVVALLFVAAGIVVFFAIPCAGLVIAPLLFLLALLVIMQDKKVWKCRGCGVILPRG